MLWDEFARNAEALSPGACGRPAAERFEAQLEISEAHRAENFASEAAEGERFEPLMSCEGHRTGSKAHVVAFEKLGD